MLWFTLAEIIVCFFLHYKACQSKWTGSIKYLLLLTGTDGLQGLLLNIHLVVMADADATIYLVEQGRTQVGELAGGDERIGTQAVVGEELGQVQTLEGERDSTD